tara:strand:- start:12676 stop:12942 length:267 start_codon:yes stop_codon:yes gene_type:complete
MPKVRKKPDVWVLCPPKPQDIKFDPDRKEYSLDYAYTQDKGLSCEVMTLKTRNYLSLHRRIERLQLDAQTKRKAGEPVDNWLFGGDHV